MASRKTLIAAAAMTAAVVAGGAAGAMLGTPGLSFAQSDTTTTTDQDDSNGWRGHRPGMRLGGLCDLDVAAEALGLSEDDLHDALTDGKTIAEIAEEQGVAIDEVIDALVDEANTRIDEAVADGDIDEADADDLRADVTERITDMVENGMPAASGMGGHGPGMGNHGPGMGGHGPGQHGMAGGGLDTAAEALGLDEDDLRDALADGKTIAEIAEEQGVDVDEVIDALVEEARDRITDFVNNGFDALDGDSDNTGDTDDTEGAAA